MEGETDPIGLALCGAKVYAVIELLLTEQDSSSNECIKIAQYLLLDEGVSSGDRQHRHALGSGASPAPCSARGLLGSANS